MRFHFKTGLILTSFLIISFLAVTILIAQSFMAKRAAEDVAEKLFTSTSASVDAQVTSLLDTPIKVSGILAQNSTIATPTDAGLNAEVRHQIFKTLEAHPSLYSIYIGKEDGSFYQIIATRGNESVHKKHNAPSQTFWIVRTIYTDGSGARQQSWSFLDDDHKVVGTQQEPAPSYDPRQRPWYGAATSRKDAALSDVYVFNSLQQPGITASHALADGSGVVGIDMTLSELSAYMTGQKLSDNSVVFMYDRKNRVVALPDRIKGVEFLSDVREIKSDAVQAVFANEATKGDFYTEIRDLKQDGPGFQIAISAPISDFTESYAQMQRNIILIILASVAVIIPAVFYFSQKLSLRISTLADDAKRIQNNDFSEREKSQTKIIELSDLEESFSNMREALSAAESLHQQQQREQEAKIQQQAKREQDIIDFQEAMVTVFEGLDSADQAMKVTATEMKGIAHNTKQQSASVSESADVTSTNVEMVASAAEELSSSFVEISSQVTHASESASSAVTKANDTSNKMSILESNVSKITELVTMINDIAHQTNMLALNATIEAARAGAAGKGFAVVAGEVKALANQTAHATEEISKQIEVVQSATVASVEAIDGVSDAIEEVNAIAASIAAAMDQQSATTSDIARNVEQAATETQNVSHEIRNLQDMADRSEAASSNMDGAANDLSNQGELLRNTVKDFLKRVQT
jgi:methyl-accepting chemotaxis protein